MRKSDIKKLDNGNLIIALAKTNAEWASNEATNRGVKQLSGLVAAICEELVIRGLITKEQSHYLQNV